MKRIEMIVALTLEIPDHIDEENIALDIGNPHTITIAIGGNKLQAKLIEYETETTFLIK